MKAYNILIGEHDHTNEKDYKQSLYDGLQFCKKEKHIHMRHDDAYIDKLLEHVESELANGYDFVLVTIVDIRNTTCCRLRH